MTDREKPYKTLGSKTVYQNPWIRVREDRIARIDGTEGIYGVMESKDSVMITVVNNASELYLVRAYSYPSDSWNWELPGGGGDGEAAIAASKRELREETGITADTWTLLGYKRVCNGLMTERMSVYLAEDLHIDEAAKDDEMVVGEGRFFSLDEVHAMMRDGRIDDCQSIAGIMLWELHRNA